MISWKRHCSRTRAETNTLNTRQDSSFRVDDFHSLSVFTVLLKNNQRFLIFLTRLFIVDYPFTSLLLPLTPLPPSRLYLSAPLVVVTNICPPSVSILAPFPICFPSFLQLKTFLPLLNILSRLSCIFPSLSFIYLTCCGSFKLVENS